MYKYKEKFASDELLRKRLNLSYLILTNKSYGVGKYDLMHLVTPSRVDVNYLALYSKPSEYRKTKDTAVCFFEYDAAFDGKDGIWNAIYYNDARQSEKLKKRFKGVRLFISPDYSLCGDVPEAFNIYNIQRSRIVSIFLALECDGIVIPQVTYSDERSFEYMLDGLEDCNVIAFSAKGSLRKKEHRDLLLKAVNYTIRTMKNLNQIIVYDVSDDFERIKRIFFRSAVEKGIELTFPDNTLHSRNIYHRGKRNGQI